MHRSEMSNDQVLKYFKDMGYKVTRGNGYELCEQEYYQKKDTVAFCSEWIITKK
jgi:hypothetical protein